MKTIETNNYQAPQVDLIEVNVEQGFAATGGAGGGTSGDDGWG